MDINVDNLDHLNTEEHAGRTAQGRSILEGRLCHAQLLYVLPILVIFLFSFIVGCYHFCSLGTNRSAVKNIESLYGPAVMLAYGHGFINPSIFAYPELREFLFGERQSLSPEMFRAPIIVDAPSSVADYHQYLVYTAAFVWRVFGVSWKSLEPLLALMLAWTAVIIFGLMRLGMNRWISFICTILVVASPAMLSIVTDLRDFSKAPFILTILLGLGWLVKYPIGARYSSLMAVLLGAMTGIAMGFRQDALVFVPISFFVFLIIGIHNTRKKLLWNLLPATLYLLFFIVLAWPMLFRMEASAGPDHHIVQGFSEKHYSNLGVYSTSFKPLLSGSDEYAFAAYYDYARRAAHPQQGHFWLDSPGAEKAARTWLMDIGKLMPADLLLRGYASAMRTLRHADAFPPYCPEPTVFHKYCYEIHRKIASHLHLFGLLYAALFLAGLAAYNFRLSLGIFVFGLYVLGYISLQCESRHAFHFSFVPFWILGFFIQQLFYLPEYFKKGVLTFKNTIPRFALRIFFYVVCCCVMALTPLFALRAFQDHQMQIMLKPYLSAERILCPISRSSRHGWTLFSVDQRQQKKSPSDLHALCKSIALLTHPELRIGHTRSRYMVAEFDGTADISWLALAYDSYKFKNDFSQMVHFRINKTNSDRLFVYFPVYEMLNLHISHSISLHRNHFVGLAVPEGQAHALKALYEITDTASLPFLMTLALHDNALPETLHYKIDFFPDRLLYYQSENQTDYPGLADFAIRAGRSTEAVLFLQSLLLLGRQPQTFMNASSKLMAMGNLAAAFEGVREVVGHPLVLQEGVYGILKQICLKSAARGEFQLAKDALELLETASGEAHPYFFLEIARAYTAADMKAEALETFKTILFKYPDNEAGVIQVNDFLKDNCNFEEQVAFWLASVERTDNACLSWFYLGQLLETKGDQDAAAKAYTNAYKGNCSNPKIAIYYSTTQTNNISAEESIQIIGDVIKRFPSETALAVSRLLQHAVILQEKGQYEDVLLLLELVESYGENNSFTYLLESEALISLGRYGEAKALLLPLLDTKLSENAAAFLNQIIKKEKGPDECVAVWEKLQQKHTGNETVTRYWRLALGDLGVFLFEARDFSQALKVLEVSCEPECLDPLHQACRLMAAMALEPPKYFSDEMIRIINDHPEITEPVTSWLHDVSFYLRDKQHNKAALILAEKATTIMPEDGLSWLNRGIFEADLGNKEKAMDFYSRSLIVASSDGDKLAVKVDEQLRTLCSDEERLDFWRELVELYPQRPAILMGYAYVLEDEGHLSKSLPYYKTALLAFPENGVLQIRYGGALCMLGEIEYGLKEFQAAMAKSPQLITLVTEFAFRAGNVQQKCGNLEGAIDLFRFAHSCVPDNILVGMAFGNALSAAGYAQEAGQAYSRIIELAPETPAAWEAAREWDHLLKSNETARVRAAVWQAAHERVPRALPMVIYLLAALSDAGDTSTSLEICEQLLSQGWEAAEMQLTYRALSYLSGKFNFKETLSFEESTNFPQPVIDLAYKAAKYAFDKSELHAAERLARIVAYAQPENLSYQVLLGETLVALGRNADALECFLKVLTVAPESPRTANMVDSVFEKLGQPEARLEFWRHLLEVHPESPLLKKRVDSSSTTPDK